MIVRFSVAVEIWRSQGRVFLSTLSRIVFFLSYTTTGIQNGAMNVGSVNMDRWKVPFGGTPVLHLDESDLSCVQRATRSILQL